MVAAAADDENDDDDDKAERWRNECIVNGWDKATNIGKRSENLDNVLY